jgi:hypothetical protein
MLAATAEIVGGDVNIRDVAPAAAADEDLGTQAARPVKNDYSQIRPVAP